MTISTRTTPSTRERQPNARVLDPVEQTLESEGSAGLKAPRKILLMCLQRGGQVVPAIEQIESEKSSVLLRLGAGSAG